MAFQEVASLETDTTITLGGTDKTGRPNPTKIEGYFLGSRNTGPNKYNKQKDNLLHVFSTPKGNVGVWGKTNLDQKLKSVVPGTMVRATFTGEKDVGKGNPMLCYKVEVDSSNTVPVADSNSFSASSEDSDSEYQSQSYVEDDSEEQADEIPPQRPSAPAKAARTPDAASQARTKALLNGGRTRA